MLGMNSDQENSGKGDTKQATAHRIHRNPTVHPHCSGLWTVCIGKVKSRDGSRLRRKDWYLKGTKAEAEANRIAKDWAFLVGSWERLHQPTLEIIGSPFAKEPHWQVISSRQAAEQYRQERRRNANRR